MTEPNRQSGENEERIIEIEIITQPGIDLWQRTYYHFRNDNSPVLQIETEERFFSFIVKTDFILDDDRRKMQSFLKKHFKKNPVQYMNMSRIFLFTTIFFTIFPSIIRKIFHCNDYSYPPSP